MIRQVAKVYLKPCDHFGYARASPAEELSAIENQMESGVG